jgi:hypothetical protein
MAKVTTSGFPKRSKYFFYLFTCIACAYIIGMAACKNEPGKVAGPSATVEETLTAANPKLKLLPAEQTGIDFQNKIIETLENNITTNINMYNGGGMCVADINNDNLPDIYFICTNGKNRLYLNEGGLKFKDITDSAGVGSEEGFETAVTAADVNADGFLDLYVCRGGTQKDGSRVNQLFINNGNLTFTEKAAEYGLDDKSACTGANFFDYDNDGDLDCYVLTYPTEGVYTNKIEAKLGDDKKYHPYLVPKAQFDADRLYRNDNGKFKDVSQEAGIWSIGYGLSVSVTDFNHDGWLDIYVGNDFIQPDMLYINNKNGTFTDRIAEYFHHSSQHTMGNDISDFDNDGLVDVYTVDMLSANHQRQKSLMATNSQSKQTAIIQNGYFEPVVRNTLQRNNGNGTFSDVGCIAGVYKTDWSWSGLLFDIDNDGYRDIHVTNGYRREVIDRDFIDFKLPEIQTAYGEGKKFSDLYPNPEDFFKQIPTYKARNFCFQNKGNWQFNDVSGNWMTMEGTWSCGAVWSDLDADGDLDLVVNNLEQPSFVYENTSKGQTNSNYLQAKLQGSAKNPFAVGASVLISYENGRIQYQELNTVHGIFSSVEHLIHFGLGAAQKVDKFTIRWPDGKTQILTDVNANQRLTLKYADASGYVAALVPPQVSNKYFKDVTSTAGLNFKHEENIFNDFENWPLYPWKISDLGPLLAKGDVNGDGLDDVFIGNAFDKSGALFVQTAGGTFKPIASDIWETDKIYEDQGALFFDADGDKDLDLFVVSGGAEATSPQAWQNRLYINLDGKGKFAKVQGAIPANTDVALRVTSFDYDHDGDNDLFIGGRVTPGKWPLTPRSVVLRNDRSTFTDVTAEVAPEFERCGMVTDLNWADIDGDQQPELIVVGEWMPVTIFKLNGGKLQNITKQAGLDQSNGLWNRLEVADLDHDGDLDLISGNFGQNTRLQAAADAPLRCFAKDFDNNGTLDPIMAEFENKKLYPLYQKPEMTKQMPILKKKFLYSKEYSQATMDQIWPQKDLDAALNLYAYTLETCWWENQGGKFVKHALPIQAQVSVVQGIIADDFNNDGNPDLLIAGNKYGLDVETNRCDSGNGALFLGDGKGNFTWVNNVESGFWAMQEARDITLLKGSGTKKLVIVANNNSKPQVFQR